MSAHVSLSAAEFLQRAALEIEQCRRLVDTVESAAIKLSAREWHGDFQSIDLLNQMLGDLSVLLDTLAQTPELDGLILKDTNRLTSPLRLGAVRARLHETPHDTGDHNVELF